MRPFCNKSALGTLRVEILSENYIGAVIQTFRRNTVEKAVWKKRKTMASMFLLSLLLLTSTLYMVKSEDEEVIYCAVCLFHFLKPKHCDCSYYHHRWSTMNFKEENSPALQESRRQKVRHQKQVQRHQRLYFIGK
ncbi:uncharacterized protein LOC132759833 [Ruditapes philippinarum]|uniref:uncharacterized protein LOC132759833 n=1 Tax=Ruditapes philippinarum TaxID=129788 RepID=UPI00295ACCDA|nr:uncharacterized protein LOC132759833 [Ruditapes philippinarum]